MKLPDLDTRANGAAIGLTTYGTKRTAFFPRRPCPNLKKPITGSYSAMMGSKDWCGIVCIDFGCGVITKYQLLRLERASEVSDKVKIQFRGKWYRQPPKVRGLNSADE